MNVIGHVSVAQLLAWPPGQRFSATATFWVIAGALAPDILDKGLILLGVYPWGRTLGHSVFTWIVLGLIARLLTGRGRGWSLKWFVAGGASHLLMDVFDDIINGLHYTGYVFSAWFSWPLLNPDLYPIQVAPLCGTPIHGMYTVAEAFVFVLILKRATQERFPSNNP